MTRPMPALVHLLIDEDDEEPVPSPPRLLRAPGLLIAERYRLRAKIARGRMATIWEADDIRLGGVVAVKFLSDALTQDVGSRKRIELEASAASQLRSPFATRIHGSGIANEVPFIVMERLYGEDLQRRLERVGRLPLPLVGKIVHEAGHALHEAHSRGIIHRDLKPGNLFLSGRDGFEMIKLLDFGVAKDMGRSERITRTGVLVGSPAYMSPEQISGDRTVDARTDLWSLGVIVYRALTGEKPFGGDLRSMMREITRGTPRKPSSICSDLPPAVDEFLAKALAGPRDLRFRDASDFVACFQDIVRERSTDPRGQGGRVGESDSVATWRPPSESGPLLSRAGDPIAHRS